jgi:hypothetical protein
MADDKTKQDNRDRLRVAGEQDYEVEYFARRHNISIERAKSLIERYGNDREKLDREASRIA